MSVPKRGGRFGQPTQLRFMARLHFVRSHGIAVRLRTFLVVRLLRVLLFLLPAAAAAVAAVASTR